MLYIYAKKSVSWHIILTSTYPKDVVLQPYKKTSHERVSKRTFSSCSFYCVSITIMDDKCYTTEFSLENRKLSVRPVQNSKWVPPKIYTTCTITELNLKL